MALTQTQKDDLASRIKTAQDALKTLDADIATATKAGIDVTDARARHTELANKIRLLNLHYFNK